MADMEKGDIVAYWLSEAEEARKVAWHLFEKKDYSYSLFFGHLAVEKMLKAILAQRTNEEIPRSHNLLRLLNAAGVEASEERCDYLMRITGYNLEARYPDYKRAFRKKCSKEFTEVELGIVEEVMKWLASIVQS